MLIDVQQVLSTSGKTEIFKVNFGEEEISYNGISLHIIYNEPFDLCLQNADNQKLMITGTSLIKGFIPCDRCLEDVEISFDIKIERSLKTEDGQVVIDLDEEDDAFYADHRIDSDRLIYDEILVNWPAKVLCQEDCKGICHVCGQNLNLKSCGCDRTVLDPRMAAFQDIFNEFKEV